MICAATQDGGYEVALRLVCGLVSLPALGELVKASVGRTAAAAGIALDNVSVHVAGLVSGSDQ